MQQQLQPNDSPFNAVVERLWSLTLFAVNPIVLQVISSGLRIWYLDAMFDQIGSNWGGSVFHRSCHALLEYNGNKPILSWQRMVWPEKPTPADQWRIFWLARISAFRIRAICQ